MCVPGQVGGQTRPVRVRVLDLPFTAVEWVLRAEPTVGEDDEASQEEGATSDQWMVLARSPLAQQRSLLGWGAQRAAVHFGLHLCRLLQCQ